MAERNSGGLGPWPLVIGAALVMRLALLATISWIVGLTAPVFTACQNWCWKPLETIRLSSLPERWRRTASCW